MEAMRCFEEADVRLNGHPGAGVIAEVEGPFGRPVSDAGHVGKCAFHVVGPQLDAGDVREEGEGELQAYL